MRRVLLSSATALLLATAIAPVALAAGPVNGCAHEASGYFLVDRDEWWAITVAGFQAEGLTVYEAGGTTFTASFEAFAVEAGFANAAALETFVRVEQWAEIDHNDNGLVCMKRRPVTRGNPAYFFNGVDDVAAAPA
ncbi:MAG: hypothetical protein ABI622_08795 [Chloroflexota bacterium]